MWFTNLCAMYKEYQFKKRVAKAPKNLDEALLWLKKNSPYICEDEDTSKMHFSLGMHLRNEWGLWYPQYSILARYFNSIGIYHADDMSSIILESYHRQLNGIPIDLDDQIKCYQEYWKKYNAR